jgi:integrase
MNQSEQKSLGEIKTLLGTPHKSFAGMTFLPSGDHWKLRHQYPNANLAGSARLLFTDESWDFFRLALARYAQSNKVGTVCGVANTLNSIANRWGAGFDILNEADFLSLKQKFGREREDMVGRLRSFFKFWLDTGIGGISKDFIKAIYQVKLQGTIKGEAVKSYDPYIGPYTPIELQGIVDGVNNAYLEDRLSTIDYALIMLLVQRGSRTNQVKNLCVGDFVLGRKGAKVHMPRAKQRGSGFREEFTTTKVSEDLYKLIRVVRKESIEHIRGLLPSAQQHLTGHLTDGLLPLFIGDFSRFAQDLPAIIESQKASEDHHIGENSLAYRLTRVGNLINVHSERTGEALNFTTARFRRTLGTDASREGAGVGQIAQLMDHTDYQSAGVYVSTTADIATRLDRKIGKLLAPLAQAFAGVLVRHESEAVRGDNPESRIRTMAGSDNVGTCGNFSFCGSRAPIACYTCAKFQPWIEAPHEENLNSLYEERQEILDATGDETIARQLDRSILAIEDVIRRCERKRIEIAEVETSDV